MKKMIKLAKVYGFTHSTVNPSHMVVWLWKNNITVIVFPSGGFVFTQPNFPTITGKGRKQLTLVLDLFAGLR